MFKNATEFNQPLCGEAWIDNVASNDVFENTAIGSWQHAIGNCPKISITINEFDGSGEQNWTITSILSYGKEFKEYQSKCNTTTSTCEGCERFGSLFCTYYSFENGTIVPDSLIKGLGMNNGNVAASWYFKNEGDNNVTLNFNDGILEFV